MSGAAWYCGACLEGERYCYRGPGGVYCESCERILSECTTAEDRREFFAYHARENARPDTESCGDDWTDGGRRGDAGGL